MDIEVKEDANQTCEFDKDFVKRLVQRQPLYEGEDMDFVLDEEKDLFPAFKEEASPFSMAMMAHPIKSKEDFETALKLYPPEVNIKAELLNIDRRNELKAQDLKLYLKGRFNQALRILDVVMIRKNPLKVRVLLSIKSPEEIYFMADQLGLARPANNSDNLAAEKEPGTTGVKAPRLSEDRGKGYLVVPNHNPTQIFISKTSSRQYKLLQALFNPKIGTTKTLDALFEAVKTRKDVNTARLSSFSTGETAKVAIIKNTTAKIYTKLKKYGLQGALNIKSANKSYRATWWH